MYIFYKAFRYQSCLEKSRPNLGSHSSISQNLNVVQDFIIYVFLFEHDEKENKQSDGKKTTLPIPHYHCCWNMKRTVSQIQSHSPYFCRKSFFSLFSSSLCHPPILKVVPNDWLLAFFFFSKMKLQKPHSIPSFWKEHKDDAKIIAYTYQDLKKDLILTLNTFHTRRKTMMNPSWIMYCNRNIRILQPLKLRKQPVPKDIPSLYTDWRTGG